MYKWLTLLVVLCLTACGDSDTFAPVDEPRWRSYPSHAGQHVVSRGETLYAIAFRYDQDYRQLAAYNHLSSPYTISVGQVIRIQPGRQRASYVVSKPQPTIYVQPRRSIFSRYRHGRWLWPAQGRVVTSYAPERGKKGIDIAGQKGAKIYASTGGVVAYAGNGLAGYGNLIIIRHDSQYLTAYGNNARNLVAEGQVIRAGQVIAEMGIVDRRFYGVHFEMRQAGKPVNPLNYL